MCPVFCLDQHPVLNQASCAVTNMYEPFLLGIHRCTQSETDKSDVPINIITFAFVKMFFKKSSPSLTLQTSASCPNVNLPPQGRPVRDVTRRLQVASTLTSTINEINTNSTLIYSVTLKNDSILHLKY